MIIDPATTIIAVGGGGGGLALAVGLVKAATTYALAQHDLAQAVRDLTVQMAHRAEVDTAHQAQEMALLQQLVNRANYVAHGGS